MIVSNFILAHYEAVWNQRGVISLQGPSPHELRILNSKKFGAGSAGISLLMGFGRGRAFRPASPAPTATPAASATPAVSPTPVFTAVTFAQVNQAVFQTSCLQCHNSTRPRGNVTLDTYANVTHSITDVIADINSGDMPANGPLTAAQKSLFDAWVAQGTPQ